MSLLTRDELRENLLGALNSGVKQMIYVGHAGGGLAREQLLSRDDIPLLTNTHTPVFIGLGCLVNSFSYPFGAALGETMVLGSDQGFVASWSESLVLQNVLAEDVG